MIVVTRNAQASLLLLLVLLASPFALSADTGGGEPDSRGQEDGVTILESIIEPAPGQVKASTNRQANYYGYNQNNEANQNTNNNNDNNMDTADVDINQSADSCKGKRDPAQPRATHEGLMPTSDDQYLIGVGMADITGPAADINLMGYAKPNQDSSGIHLRQFSRTIILADRAGSRIAYVSLDNGMVSQLLRQQVLKHLIKKYHGLYDANNVMISASHSHSCPGGFFQVMLYNIPSQGFIAQTLEALVSGILRSFDRANNNMKLGRLSLIEGNLLDASINRSPTSYAANPASERAQYKYDTDKEMVLVRVDDMSGNPLAMLNWFPVHGTSMNNTNHLISGDNKGYASLLFEEQYNNGALPGKGQFVAVFAQANEGDVSPNTNGPRCIDTGVPCDSATSTCGHPPRNEKCVASGPGKDMFESTKIIAYKQFQKALELFHDVKSQVRIRGPIKYIHQHVDMSSQVVEGYSHANATHRTCLPALGYSFAAGTIDGPGAFDFQQGDTSSSPFWNMARDFLRKPSEQQVRCHHPKPVLFSTGEMNFPYAWHPTLVPTQILQVGQLAIVGLPGEFTTMAGRRVRNALSCVFNSNSNSNDNDDDDDDDDDDTDDKQKYCYPLGSGSLIGNSSSNSIVSGGEATRHKQQSRKSSLNKRDFHHHHHQQQQVKVKVVLSGLSNIYTSYVTTFEEYQVQRYEGASTIYGPHTLAAYLKQFSKLAALLKEGHPIDEPGPEPADLLSQQIVLKPGVIYDGAPYGKHFGDTLEDVDTDRMYKCGETVRAAFVAGHPRNDLRQEGTFMLVEAYNNKTKEFRTIATDSSWDTKFIWQRTNTLLGESKAILEWQLPHNCQTGLYRMQHFGASKSLVQNIRHYSGQSSVFRVVQPGQPKAQDQLEQLLADYLEQGANGGQPPVDIDTLASGEHVIQAAATRPTKAATTGLGSTNHDQVPRSLLKHSSFSLMAILSSIFN